MKKISCLLLAMLCCFSASAQFFRLNNWTTNTSTGAITSLTADASPDGATDYVSVYDASAGTLKKVLLSLLPGAGQVFTNASNLFSANSSNTFLGQIRFTQEPLNSSLIFDAVVKETSGYVSSGLTALTVTGGSLVAADVGKTIQVWQPDRVFVDAYITNATAKLVSATAAFTSADVGKTVEVSGAGPTSFSLLSTISTVDSATQVTLAGNASTTAQNVSARIISVPFVTTIAAVGGSTSATLTAAPAVTHTNANVVYGTDNRVALSNDCASAQLAHRNLRLGSGKAMILLTSASPWATALSTNDLNIIGTGKGSTEIVMITDAIPSVAGGIFRVNTSASLRARDLTVRCYSPNTTNDVVASGFPIAFYMAGGGATQYMSLEHVDVFGAGNATFIASGTANTRKMWAQDCRWITMDVNSCFFGFDTGVYERRMRDCYLETDNQITTSTTDTQYNCHTVYDHPAVSEDWTDGQFYSLARAGAAYHIHHYGSQTLGCAFLRFTRCKFSGLPNAVYSATTGVTTEFIEPIFEQSGNGALLSGDAAIYGGRTRNTNQTAILSPLVGTTGEHFTVIGHDFQNTNTQGKLLSSSVSGMDVYVAGSYIAGVAESSTATSNKSVYVGTTFIGQNPASAQAFAAAYAGTASLSNGIAKFIGCYFKGDFHDECIRFRIATNFDLEISDCRNDTARPIVHDTTSGGGVGAMAYGHDNFYTVSGGEPQSDSRLGSHFAARKMLNPTAIASAATINPSFNFDTHQVSGSTTIDTILVGGDTTRNVMAYQVTLIASSGATWAISLAGNVVPLITTARTAGQAYTFRWDSIDQKWRELGLPQGIATGDITSVGDVTGGAAFDGTQGTTLTFNDPGGDHTFKFNTTLDQFEISTNLYALGSLLATNESRANSMTATQSFTVLGTGLGTLIIGSAGVTLSDNGDGGLNIVGNGNGFDENLLLDLDNISNTATYSSTSGVATVNFSGMQLQENGAAVPNNTDNLGFFASTTGAQLASTLSDETGTGVPVFSSGATTTNQVLVTATGTTPSAADNSTKIATTAYVQTELSSFTGGAPGGANGDVQIKSGTSLAGESAFNYNSTNKTLSVPNIIVSTNFTMLGNTNGVWHFWDGDASQVVGLGAAPNVLTNFDLLLPVQPSAGLLYASDTGTTNTNGAPIFQLSWTNPPTGTSGTVINTGTPVVSQVPRYTDTTGTNVAPSTMTVAALGGVVITNSDTTNVSFNIKGPSGGTNDLIAVSAGGTNYVKINSKGQILGVDGVSVNPTFAFANAIDTGMKWRNPGLSWEIVGVEKLILTASALTALVNIDINASATPYLSILSDTYIGREAVNVWRLGLDGAAPSAQTFKGPNGSGTDKAGGDVTLYGGRGTGTNKSGAFIVSSGNTATTGSTLHTVGERLHIADKFVNLTAASDTLFCTITNIGSGKYCSVKIYASINADDGTDFQSLAADVNFSIVNKAGTVTPSTVIQVVHTTAASSGTITSPTFTAVASGNGVDVKCNTASSLTETTLRIKYMLWLNSNDAATVIEIQN